MSELRPRKFAHEGVVAASGFIVSVELTGLVEARRRIIAMAEGSTVHLVPHGFLVQLAKPTWIACSAAPGLPLVRVPDRDIIASMELDSDEIDKLAPPRGSIVVARAGALELLDVGEAEDPSTWLDVSCFELETVSSLGVIRTAPVAAVVVAKVDARGALGVGPAADEVPRVLAAIAERARASGSVRAGHRASSTLISASRFLARTMSFLAALVSRVRSSGARTTSRALVATPQTKPAGPTFLDRLRSRLEDAAARLLLWSRLASFLGRAQARYLQRMLEMFDTGDLDGALRHAIPLGDKPGKEGPPALLPPSPRADLAIVPHRAAASSSIGLGSELFAFLRTRYRQAFERLDALGRHREAAFVLAELLGASEEAVSYLERHGMLHLAAEIAEARGLPVGLVVRQWWLAGERRRAVDIARANGAFSDAVLRLERSNEKDQSVALRLAWADTLADAGAFGAAVDVVWSVPAAHALALGWIDHALEIGGATAARMLAKKVHLAPAEFPAIRSAAVSLLADDSREGPALRIAFATELATLPARDETRVLARATLRALLADSHCDKRLVDGLVGAMDDAILRADISRANPKGREEKPAAPRPIRVDVAARTETGPTRASNEDWVFVCFEDGTPMSAATDVKRAVPPRGALFGVFDAYGLSGRSAEAWAKPLAEAIRHRLGIESQWARVTPSLFATALGAAMQAAAQLAFQRSEDAAEFHASGCTAAVAAVANGTLAIAHVGDARAYLLRDGALSRLTEDHSLANQLVEEGKLRPEEVATFPHKNVITRALGTGGNMRADVSTMECRAGDMLFLSTDGVHTKLDDREIQKLLSEPDASAASMAEKFTRVLETTAGDNFSFIIVRFIDALNRANVEPARTTPVEAIAPPVIRRIAADRGALAVLDAAPLPRGRLLVALGEAGARVLAPDGKTLAHFFEPAYRLVISDHGDRALAMAPRGKAWRIARIDITSRRTQAWCDARLTCFAYDFDGSTWLVGDGDGLFMIDAVDIGWRSLWSTRERGTKPVRIARSPGFCATEWRRDEHGETTTQVLTHAQLVLRRRRQLETDVRLSALSPSGSMLGFREATAERQAAIVYSAFSGWRDLAVPAQVGPSDSAIGAASAAIGWRREGRAEIEVLDKAEGVIAHVVLEGATSIGLRAMGTRVVIHDDRGRVLVVSSETGEVEAEWRVS